MVFLDDFMLLFGAMQGLGVGTEPQNRGQIGKEWEIWRREVEKQ